LKINRLAPAKVNLMLHVVGRLPDGYHHLQSLVTFASIGDQVTFEKAAPFRLTIDGVFGDQVPLTANNSVVLAVRWLEKKYPGIGQAHIHLTKNLPVASGIGGGSSDAAATIAGLLQGFGISLSRADEEALILGSSELGADIPLCLAHQLGWGPMLWIEGSGRDTLPIPLNLSLPGPMLLVNPGVHVSTPAIFKRVHPPYTMPQDFRHTFEKDFQGDLFAYLRGQKNDLMAPAMGEEPKIKEVMEALQNTPGCLLAGMSGSGATCFAVFEDKKIAQAAQTGLLTKMPEAWVGLGDCL
jgi:4-diphosphocytidyl-2-C-methyl-D-erythritol kinase